MSFFAFDSARLWRGDHLDAVDASLIPNTRRLLWKFRHALTGEKKALPKFLLAVDWRDATEVAQVPALLKQWTRIDVADAIKLLGPDQAYQRRVVRAFAVDALRAASDMELVTYLLQLVQALRYDEKDEKGRSPLASFLSERAARSVAVANFVWWYLKVGVRMQRYFGFPPSTPSTRRRQRVADVVALLGRDLGSEKEEVSGALQRHGRLVSRAGRGRDGRAVLCYVSRV